MELTHFLDSGREEGSKPPELSTFLVPTLWRGLLVIIGLIPIREFCAQKIFLRKLRLLGMFILLGGECRKAAS